MGTVYQPRSRGAAMSDALADARYALARLLQILILRGAGGVVLLCTLAVALSLASYSPGDPSLNNATGRDVANWLGPLGATAADVLLQALGIAAIAFVAPLAVWGARALMGKGLSHAVWRAVAWPIGTVLVAAGLGWLPRPEALPAGAGGWIGIAASSLSTHAAQVYGQNWIGMALPLLLLVTGLPLAFIATGLRFSRLARHIGTGAAAIYWLGSKVKLPSRPSRSIVRSYDEEDEEPDTEHVEEDEYGLDIAPEPIAATRLAERRENRIKREEARRAAKPSKGAKQPALNLASGEYQLPSLGLLTEPPRVQDTQALSDEALEENARMLEAVLGARDFAFRRRGAFHVGGGGAHRHHSGPQRHRHRVAQSKSRDGLSA
jgi:S-DNA-T family DNA segregation ATPase FtsK/SpoIIIE